MKHFAIILVGLPGSGKSTEASRLKNMYQSLGWSVAIHSTDAFFMHEGEYKFDPKKLNEYHMANLLAFETSLEKKVNVVICDNTNLKMRDRQPYVEAAEKNQYGVVFHTIGKFDSPSITAYYSRGIHKVPLETLSRMAKGAELLLKTS